MRFQTNTTTETGGYVSPRTFWPDAVAYREAIQNPQLALGDAELRGGEVVLDRRGLPLAYTGKFAVVFRLRTPSGDWALRCFTQSAESVDRLARYEAIAQRSGEIADYLVPFRYLEEGIRVGRDWYPVVAMRWAEGETLGRYVDRHHQDRGALNRLSVTLARMLERLEAAGVTHGDWQHDNLLVSGNGDRVTLVDYDGMFVPELAGRLSAELGHPNYQHPARTSYDFGPGQDRFSHLVMQTALAALGREPALWARFNDGESLLFKRSDFEAPGRSALFHTLGPLAAADAALALCLEKLAVACGAPADFETAVPDIVPLQSAATPPPPGETSKWWLSPDVVTFRRSPRPATILAAQRAFVAELSNLQNLEFEKTNLWTVRVSLAGRAALLGGLWALTSNAAFAEFWTLASLLLVGVSYNAWPRRKVRIELTRAIEAAEQQIQELETVLEAKRTRRIHVDAGLASADSESYVKYRLSRIYLDYIIGYRAGYDLFGAVQRLQAAGYRTVANLKHLTRADCLSGTEWNDFHDFYLELETQAVEEFARLPLEQAQLHREIPRLETEQGTWRRRYDALCQERDTFPDSSLSLYLRKVVGAG